MTEQMWPEAQEPKMQPEKIAETIDVLQEEYAVLAVDRQLQMMEVEYRKMVDIKNRIPKIDELEEGVLEQELILAQLFFLEVANDSLGQMEKYFREHGDQWNDMTR